MEQYSILAVDDEPFNLDLIEAAFIEYEYINISYARSGEEALNLLNEKEFDVILLDISMPKMDGLEVLQKIRANKNFKTLPVLMVTANTEKEKESLSLGASDFISKPYDIDILCSRTINYARLQHFTKQIKNQNIILEEKIHERTKDLENALSLSKETEFEISLRLGRASESRDPETGGHIKRMSHYSRLLAELYGLDNYECELILYASPLHDIGKIAIPDSILLKPGKFEKDEFEIMKTHAKLGAKLLEGADRFPILKAGQIIALEHHEKYDGSGYPNAKSAEDIHLYARIVAIADVFDALSAKRCYKDPVPLDKVLQIMKEGRGKHFDPKLIDIFLKNIDKFLEIRDIYKDENCLPFEEIEIQSEKSINIVFVDDNALNRMLVQEMLILVFPNITIDIFEKAEDVLKLELDKYDIILTDINMPDIDGIELYTRLREQHSYNKPIIAVTANTDDKNKQTILQYGFDDFIPKPIDITTLEEKIKLYI
jgi:putative two-component system response regulator